MSNLAKINTSTRFCDSNGWAICLNDKVKITYVKSFWEKQEGEYPQYQYGKICIHDDNSFHIFTIDKRCSMRLDYIISRINDLKIEVYE